MFKIFERDLKFKMAVTVLKIECQFSYYEKNCFWYILVKSSVFVAKSGIVVGRSVGTQ